MRRIVSFVLSPLRRILAHFFSVVACGLSFLAYPISAQVITLTDNNSSLVIDTAGPAGVTDWVVDGQDQLSKLWYYFRLGSTHEASVDTISAPSISTPNARTLSTLYTAPTFSIRIDYLLGGAAPGSGLSDLGQTITINNLSASPLDFHLFKYADFDLLSTSGGDTVQLGKNLQNKFNEAAQMEGSSALSETVLSPGANHAEVDFVPAILTRLTDANVDTLADTVGPLGPGNVAWAFQWDFLIPVGGSASISAAHHVVVPEPSTIALLLLGVGGLVMLRRQRGR